MRTEHYRRPTDVGAQGTPGWAAIMVLGGLVGLSGCGLLDPAPQDEPERETAEAAPVEHVTTERDPVSRARKMEREGNLDAARVEFERAIASNPTLTVAYLGAGDIYRKQGDMVTAEERYSQAAILEPGNFDAQYLHGLTLQVLDRLSDAVRAYLKALAIRPDDFSANLNLATTYLQLQEPAQGLPYAQRAVKLDPRSAPARTNLGAIYSALDRNNDAVTEYQQAAELAQLTAPLLINLADSLGKVGRYEEMVNTLQQLVATTPSAGAYERLGSGLFRLRRYDQAEGAFRESIALDADYYPALNGAAVCLLNRWVWSNSTDDAARYEAIALMRRSLILEKRQPRIVELIGRYQ